jgi:hypothetical protein
MVIIIINNKAGIKIPAHYQLPEIAWFFILLD